MRSVRREPRIGSHRSSRGWRPSEAAGVTGRVFEASGQFLAVAEGWVRGPSDDPIDDPTKLGDVVPELLADARPNSGMDGRPGSWPQPKQ